MGSAGSTKRRQKLGQRQEFQILLPVALLILIGLSTFTLFSYRSSIEFLFEEKERELVRQARPITASLARGALPAVHDLRLQLPTGVQATVFDEGGSILVSTSEQIATLRTEKTNRVGWMMVEIPAEYRGRSVVLLVEQPSRLIQSRDGLRILIPVVLVINGLVVLLVLLYFRSFLAPIDRLVEHAQRVRPADSETTDEVAHLVETFDRALEALARPDDQDLLALQRTLAPSMESGVLLCDNRRAVIALNEVGADLLGIAQPEAEAPLEEVLHHHPELCSLLSEAMRTQKGEHRTECTIQVSDTKRTLGLTVHVLRRDDGNVRGFLVLFIDLTVIRKQSNEKRLAETLVELGEIAAGVAHELRNSVATLNGYLTLVERGGDAESIADFTSEIRRETEHLRRVVDDFLAFSRPGTARTEHLDLIELTRQVASDPALEGAAVRVDQRSADMDPSAFMVLGDSQLLERALRNLVRNAAQAQQRSGSTQPIEILLELRGENLRIQIDDHGPGIAPEIRPRLFHPFVSGRPNGVGLGLALSLRIIHLHGGDLTLDDRPGGGARAVVQLPSGVSVT